MSVKEKMTAIADAIREKTGGTEEMTLDAMAEAITGIEAGGGGSSGNVDELRGVLSRTGTTFTDDTITTLGKYACAASELVSVNLPAVKIGKGYIFNACYSLETVYLPKLTSTGGQAFSNCSKLKTVHMPLLSEVPLQDFANCYAVELLDFHNLAKINGAGFQNARSLATLILRKSSVCSLANTNAFNGTPFASGGTGGTVYVPSALIESYKTATNWSTLYTAGTCNFVAIEGSEYE